jgi:hypothetical protein
LDEISSEVRISETMAKRMRCFSFDFAPTQVEKLLRNGAKMKDPLVWLTPKQAADLCGYSARTIQNFIMKGKISATKEDGKYYIDKAEFFRVFPDAHRRAEKMDGSQREVEIARKEVENEYLKEMISQKDKDIEFLKSQLESFTGEKKQMLEAITHHARLLEHKESRKEQESQEKKSWMDIFKRKKD